MPKYFIRFDVVEEWKGTFDADNLEHAKELVRQLKDDEIGTDELPNFDDRNSGIMLEVYEDSLEELPSSGEDDEDDEDPSVCKCWEDSVYSEPLENCNRCDGTGTVKNRKKS